MISRDFMVDMVSPWVSQGDRVSQFYPEWVERDEWF